MVTLHFCSGRNQLQVDRDRIPYADFGNYHGGCMGTLCLGNILELGSERDMVTDYLVYLCCFFACPIHQGLEGKKSSGPLHRWICVCIVHLFRSQLSHLRTSQLPLSVKVYTIPHRTYGPNFFSELGSPLPSYPHLR